MEKLNVCFQIHSNQMSMMSSEEKRIYFNFNVMSSISFHRLSRDGERDGGVLGRLRDVERERDRLGVRLEYRRRGGDLKNGPKSISIQTR